MGCQGTHQSDNNSFVSSFDDEDDDGDRSAPDYSIALFDLKLYIRS